MNKKFPDSSNLKKQSILAAYQTTPSLPFNKTSTHLRICSENQPQIWTSQKCQKSWLTYLIFTVLDKIIRDNKFQWNATLSYSYTPHNITNTKLL